MITFSISEFQTLFNLVSHVFGSLISLNVDEFALYMRINIV